MGIHLNDQAFQKAADDMAALKERNTKLRHKLEQMYKNLTTALNTPAGHELNFKGKKVLLGPIDDMEKVIDLTSKVLNTIIGQQGAKGRYYDKLFDEYNELDRILKNKTKR